MSALTNADWAAVWVTFQLASMTTAILMVVTLASWKVSQTAAQSALVSADMPVLSLSWPTAPLRRAARNRSGS